MKKIAPVVLAFAALTTGAQTTNYSQVQHIHSALNHLTVIELGEPVTTFAVADPDAFSVERHGDKIFLQPNRDHKSTNLFVWTATRQLAYELDPAGDEAQMNVLIRSVPQGERQPAAGEATSPPQPDDAQIQKIAGQVASQILEGSQDIKRDDPRIPDGHVSVQLEQVFHSSGATYVRYTVANRTDHLFRAGAPVVTMMHPTSIPASLAGYRNHQLRSSTESSYKANPGMVLTLLNAASRAKDVAPGQQVTGVVGFHYSSNNPPELVQFQLGPDANQPVIAAAVL